MSDWAPPDIPAGLGWAPFSAFLGDDGLVRAHFTRDERGRWRVDALYLAAPTLDSDALRQVSVPALEARANAPDMAKRLKQLETERTPTPPPSAEAASWAAERRVGRTRARLTVPAGAKPDGFYKRVAEVYRELAGWTNRPAVELAAANKVPVTTAHRWVKEARRRGFLPPGQKGRRG